MTIANDIKEEFSSKAIARDISNVLADFKCQARDVNDMIGCTFYVAKEMITDYRSFAKRLKVAEEYCRP